MPCCIWLISIAGAAALSDVYFIFVYPCTGKHEEIAIKDTKAFSGVLKAFAVLPGRLMSRPGGL